MSPSKLVRYYGTEPTRRAETCESLPDHLFVTSPDHVKSHHVPKSGMSDHFPTSIVYNVQGFEKGHYTSIRYR